MFGQLRDLRDGSETGSEEQDNHPEPAGSVLVRQPADDDGEDDEHGAEVHHFGPDGFSLDSVRFPDSDFAALGRAAGAEALTVRSRADLEPIRDWLERRDRPLLVDAKIVPTVVAEWLPEAFGH